MKKGRSKARGIGKVNGNARQMFRLSFIYLLSLTLLVLTVSVIREIGSFPISLFPEEDIFVVNLVEETAFWFESDAALFHS